MSHATRATRVLDAAGVSYRLHTYDYHAEAGQKGVAAALALGLPASRVLKSLMAWVDDHPVCAVIPADQRLSLKKLAAARGGKSARMMDVAEAERLTGYKVGGISPLGQQRQAPVIIEHSIVSQASVIFNAGQRGLLLELDTVQALALLQAQTTDLCA